MLTCYACLGYVNLKYIFLDMFPIPPIFFVICSSQGVCHTVALPFTLKSILMQKKNYGNSSISPYKNIIFQKSSKENPKSFKDMKTLQLISSFNTSQNIIFQKSSYKNK